MTRQRFRAIAVALVAAATVANAGGCTGSAAAGPPAAQAGGYVPAVEVGRFTVETRLGEWRDDARGGRIVPWKLYLPGGLGRAAPLVVWSHGGGGTREGGRYLGEHLASHGIASLHIQHEGSDVTAFRANPRAILAGVQDPRLGEPRYRDVQFVVRQLRAFAAGEWRGLIDASRLGISGHSYGAITTLISAGQRVPGFDQALSVPQFQGGFVMSPSPPRAGYDAGATGFARMHFPLFHLTGTDDRTPAEDFPPEARRIPFDRIGNVTQYLLIINGATHMTFSGENRSVGLVRADPRLNENLPLIKAAAVAFWQAHLNGDAAARAWLERGGYAGFVGPRGTVEVKLARGR